MTQEHHRAMPAHRAVATHPGLRAAGPLIAGPLAAGLLASAILAGGCTQYRVPGAAADFAALGITREEQAAITDAPIRDEFAKRPAANFPAVIAAAHVQGLGYERFNDNAWATSGYTVIGVREAELETDTERLAALPMVRGIMSLNRFVLQRTGRDEASLRAAAARVQADMLLLYTFDTRFGVTTTVPALGVITLGLFPNDEARVTCTASAALIDTRTGYIYTLAEATAQDQQIANAWTNRDAVDQTRRRAEATAFGLLVTELERAWHAVVTEYATGPAAASAASAAPAATP